jgi:hypothetical protein
MSITPSNLLVKVRSTPAPYEDGIPVAAERFPITASVAGELFGADVDADFAYGPGLILVGMASAAGPDQKDRR